MISVANRSLKKKLHYFVMLAWYCSHRITSHTLHHIALHRIISHQRQIAINTARHSKTLCQKRRWMSTRCLHNILQCWKKMSVLKWTKHSVKLRLFWTLRDQLFLWNVSATTYWLTKLSKQQKLRHWSWRSCFDWSTLKRQQYRSAFSSLKRTLHLWMWKREEQRTNDHYKYIICLKVFAQCWVFKNSCFAL